MSSSFGLAANASILGLNRDTNRVIRYCEAALLRAARTRFSTTIASKRFGRAVLALESARDALARRRSDDAPTSQNAAPTT
jgi:hypothetical protein